MRPRFALGSVITLAISVSSAHAQADSARRMLQGTGRSMVITRYGIVAASQPLAARAGTQMLELGGTAADAAIAANAAIGLM